MGTITIEKLRTELIDWWGPFVALYSVIPQPCFLIAGLFLLLPSLQFVRHSNFFRVKPSIFSWALFGLRTGAGLTNWGMGTEEALVHNRNSGTDDTRFGEDSCWCCSWIKINSAAVTPRSCRSGLLLAILMLLFSPAFTGQSPRLSFVWLRPLTEFSVRDFGYRKQVQFLFCCLHIKQCWFLKMLIL